MKTSFTLNTLRQLDKKKQKVSRRSPYSRKVFVLVRTRTFKKKSAICSISELHLTFPPWGKRYVRHAYNKYPIELRYYNLSNIWISPNKTPHVVLWPCYGLWLHPIVNSTDVRWFAAFPFAGLKWKEGKGRRNVFPFLAFSPSSMNEAGGRETITAIARRN